MSVPRLAKKPIWGTIQPTLIGPLFEEAEADSASDAAWLAEAAAADEATGEVAGGALVDPLEAFGELAERAELPVI